MEEATWRLKDYEKDIVYCASEYEVMKGAEALVLITEWNQFRRLDLAKVKDLLAGDYFFDLRNVYEKEEVEEIGLNYVGVGINNTKPKEEVDKAMEDVAATGESK